MKGTVKEKCQKSTITKKYKENDENNERTIEKGKKWKYKYKEKNKRRKISEMVK